MPYISFQTNNKLSKEDKNKIGKKAGELITILPGKVEERLMINVEDDCHLMFRGENNPCMMIQVKLFNASSIEAKTEFANKLVNEISLISGVPVSEIFMNYAEYPNWVVNGTFK